MIGNLEILSRLLMAALLGSVIGFERERLNWAAGLRTHMLVCVGASLAERGSVSLDSLHRELETGSIRVKQFIVQQSEGDPELDDVQIALSRASSNEFTAICARLEAMSCVRECRPEK